MRRGAFGSGSIFLHSPWADGTSINQVLDHAVRLGGLLPEDQQVAEFVALVSRASQIPALMSYPPPG